MKKVYSNISDLAHGFYYTPFDGIERRAASASYIDRVFYSYATTIGYIYTDKNGKNTLFYSYDSMSNTTSKHIAALRNACLFDMLRVPFRYGYRLSAYATPDKAAQDIAQLFFERIENDIKAKAKYTQKANREYSSNLLSMACDFVKVTGAKIKNLNKYKKYLDKALNAENIKKAAQKARQAAAKKQKQIKKAVANFQKKNAKTPILESIKKYIFSFDWQAGEVARVERELFIKSFEIENPSFVMVDTEAGEVRTSQHIHFKIADILPLLRAWAHGKNILGQNLGVYTVLENSEKMLKIGCHKIPRANVQALADTLL